MVWEPQCCQFCRGKDDKGLCQCTEALASKQVPVTLGTQVQDLQDAEYPDDATSHVQPCAQDHLQQAETARGCVMKPEWQNLMQQSNLSRVSDAPQKILGVSNHCMESCLQNTPTPLGHCKMFLIQQCSLGSKGAVLAPHENYTTM